LVSRVFSRTSALGNAATGLGGNAATSIGRLPGCRSHTASMAQVGGRGVFLRNTKCGFRAIVCFSETRMEDSYSLLDSPR
jgi:hypothetical protein